MMKMTKAALNKLLVAERKKSRVKHQRSVFMSRTSGIYQGQRNRHLELRGTNTLPYTLEQLRAKCEAALALPCIYCGKKMTPKSMCGDHAKSLSRGGKFNLKNLVFIHANCNWRKGAMNDDEYHALSDWMTDNLPSDVIADIWARLALGGKWKR